MADFAALSPRDEHNVQLERLVHPADWVNPTPAERYNLVVIGAGTAGLISAIGAAGLGAKVALIERAFMGGDCLNVGCVPSKALLRAARAAAAVRDAGRFGIAVPAGAIVDFGVVMERLRRLRAQLAVNDAAARYRSLGVDVYFGEARFTGPTSVAVGAQTLAFRKAIVATGARAARPNIPGLDEIGYYTNETIFTLTALPRRLAVIGAGPIGCELAQAFARFGTAVTLIGKHPQLLPRDDPDAAALLATALQRDGVTLRLGVTVQRAEQRGDEKLLHVAGQSWDTLAVDAVLVGVGRAPNVEGLDLAAAGVVCDTRAGVQVDDHLRTTNPCIYAAGDICSSYQFTHAADAMARIAIQNALFLGRKRLSALTIPWCTYTEPEVAHVGMTAAEAQQRGAAVQSFVQAFQHVDRAVLDGASEGFIKVYVRRGSERILGATIVAQHAGDLIAQVAQAMTAGVGLGTLARTIFPYPTQAEALKKVADAYNRTRLKPWLRWLLERWLRWTR